MLDSRVDAVRRDIADIRLADRVFAPHYAEPLARTCTRRASLVSDASANASILSEVLPGETFELLDCASGYAWGIGTADGVVGYLDDHAFSGEPMPQPADTDDRAWSRDPAANAEALIGVARRRGGRSERGVDPSGLIFLALQHAGIAAPRFLDLQAGQLGARLADGSEHRRNDLLFWADRAAIMLDQADAIYVADEGVTRAPLADLVADAAFGAPVAARRLA